MQYAFLPILLFVVCVFGLAIALLILSALFNPGHPSRVTRMPYESGMDPIHDTRRRFDVRFHLLAIAFLIFDVELLFLYPWAVSFGGKEVGRGQWAEGRVASGQWPVASEGPTTSAIRHPPSAISNQQSTIIHHQSPAPRPSPPAPTPNPHLIFGGAMTFLLLLTLGFVYDWRKGVFQWH